MTIVDPYPIPTIHTVSVPVQQKYGVVFKYDGFVSVFIHTVEPSSIFKNTMLQVGQRLLMVNDVPVINAKEAVKLLKECSSISVDLKVAAVDKPYTKFVVTTFWKYTPGVSFRSARSNSLVQVDKIYTKGPFTGRNLHPGDIVLAINNKPVRNPDDAFKLLQEAAKTSNHVILYALDMEGLRGCVIEQVKESMYNEFIGNGSQFKRNTISPKIIQVTDNNKPNSFSIMVGKITIFENYEYDKDDLLLKDSRPFGHMLGHIWRYAGHNHNNIVEFNESYKYLMKFIDNINESINQDLDLLSEAVVVSVWQESYPKTSNNVTPSAPLEDNGIIPIVQALPAPMDTTWCKI